MSRIALAALCVGAVVSCRPSNPAHAPLSSELPIHLEEHLDAARVEGSLVPKNLPGPVLWHFDQPQPAWKAVIPLLPSMQPAAIEARDGGLRISLTEANRQRHGLRGGVYVDLPGWNRQDWAVLVVRARATGPVGNLTLHFNLRQSHGELFYEYEPFRNRGESANLINDGAAHSYLLRADWGSWWEGEPAWRQLGLMIDAKGPASVDILSVELVPKEARFAEKPAGVVTEAREALYRRSIYTHAPARLGVRVAVPRGGRLDFGLGVLRGDAPVTFRVKVAEEGGREETLFAATYADRDRWGQRSVDLSRWAGRTVRLVLETAPGPGGRPGSVALWATPTLSGEVVSRGRAGGPPNVILYVIDAGGAEYMSAYGYNRRTTPHLERLAQEGALFENAHSNSTWSKPSTTSFMTGLHHTVLGGFETASDPLPERAETMAQILHRAGWQTAVFTSNSWCGTMSGLERGVDQMIESISGPNSASSAELQGDFWRWREIYPGRPYWVHFQSTDVHWPWEPEAPVAGVFLSRAERASFYEMERKLGAGAGVAARFWALRSGSQTFIRSGVDREAYFDGVRGAYDEAMAYTDLQLGRLVERLKATGEWENTLLIVTADHGDWPGLGYFEATDPDARVAYLNPYLTHVPLVVVWPHHIAPGQRFREPVSLIDLLPTVLDLTVQPHPGSLQGQSLAPLLLGRPGWQPRPVILDEMNVDPKTHQLSGAIEIIDGRWGASLAIQQSTGDHAGPPLLLYDLWSDPYCRHSLHAERQDLVKHYTGLLERQFREHRTLAKQFPRTGEGALAPSQLDALKSLGYIR
jgi:arylsulfatase A-like enzyme